MPIHNRPTFTDVYESVSDFTPDPQSVYLSGRSVEGRSKHCSEWRQRVSNVEFAEITLEERTHVTTTMPDGSQRDIALRSSVQIEKFWQLIKRDTIYLDITGLRHHVWAALLRGALETRQRVIVVYVEPNDYRPSLTPTENDIYDLSERIEGISPLPGFARLLESGDRSCFVPLLGFEGTRVSYLISQLEPPGGKTIPVVGIPGFRPEYPFATYLGNRNALTQTQAWKQVRYAVANCPFDLYYVLETISNDFPDHVLKIAPVGTKPHAIGSVLYAIANPRAVELVYDHPIRKARRTEGTAHLLAYNVSALLG